MCFQYGVNKILTFIDKHLEADGIWQKYKSSVDNNLFEKLNLKEPIMIYLDSHLVFIIKVSSSNEQNYSEINLKWNVELWKVKIKNFYIVRNAWSPCLRNTLKISAIREGLKKK